MRADAAVAGHAAPDAEGIVSEADHRTAAPIEARGDARRFRWRPRVGRLLSLGWRAGISFVNHEGLELSGYAAFAALLSLFPFLLFLTALSGFLADVETANRILANAFDFLPNAVVEVLRPVILEVLTGREGGLLSIGIAVALWSASSGLEALRTIINRSYGLTETRPFWVLRLQSILLVVFASLSALIASGAIIFGPLLGDVVRWLLVAQWLSDLTWWLLRYALASSILTAVLIILHVTLPNASLPLRAVLPGAGLTVALWLLAAGAFSIYVDNLASFSVTYGSLGGIILTLLFFNLSAILFGYGAEVNAILQAKQGPPEPRKARGAKGSARCAMRAE